MKEKTNYTIFEVKNFMANNKNPFNISFGEEPKELIQRNDEYNEIIDTFTSESPSSKALIISGPRGSGKTVLMAQIKKIFDTYEDWICVDLNPFTNMLEDLASKLYDKGKLKKLFLAHEFSFSFHGLSFSISGKNPITNVNALLEIMLKYLKEKNIKVLVLIDDIAGNDNVKAFIYSYQSFLRDSYNIFLLMTGLFENISELENSNNLTFLLRTPKIFLKNLNPRAITLSYENIFDLGTDDALKLAKLTSGYAYGYQLLGNLLYKNNTNKISKKILSDYDLSLEENVYGKIWSQLSDKDKTICFSMCESNKVSDIVDKANLNNSALQVYKKRLEKQGIIDTSSRGKITFTLPRFKEFVEFQKKLLESN